MGQAVPRGPTRPEGVLQLRPILALLVIAAVVITATFLLWPKPPPAEPEVPTIYLFVNDLATPPAMFSFEAQVVDNLCAFIEEQSTAEIAVLVVSTTQPWGIDIFAQKTFEKNVIGKVGEDNGLLLLVSIDERQWRVEVGYGLEPTLNDAKVGRLGREFLEPNLTAGFYYDGIFNMVDYMGGEIFENYDPATAPKKPAERLQFDWVMFCGVMILLAVVSSITGLRMGGLAGGLGGFMRRGGFGGGRSGGGGARGRF